MSEIRFRVTSKPLRCLLGMHDEVHRVGLHTVIGGQVWPITMNATCRRCDGHVRRVF